MSISVSMTPPPVWFFFSFEKLFYIYKSLGCHYLKCVETIIDNLCKINAIMIISSVLLKTISYGGILYTSWKETGLYFISIMVRISSNSRGDSLKYMYMD